MTISPEIENLKQENQKFRGYVSFISSQIELTQRIREIKQNFTASYDSERLTMPILDRLSKIHSEKSLLEKELGLN